MDEKLSVLKDVAKYYYIENLTQEQIAHRMGLSRPKISRLLSLAREKGVVKVFISDFEENMEDIEEQLKTIFNLKRIKVVPVPPNDNALAFQVTCKEAAKYIAELLEDGDRIGVGWGGTLYEISKNLQHLSRKNSIIVQLFGNLDTGEADDYANDILSQFALKLDVKSSHIIPCPVIVDNQIIYDILMHDDKIKSSMNLAKSCNKMLINIGLPTEDNCLYKGGYIGDNDLQFLRDHSAAGCIGCRFYDEQGHIIDPQLDSRTIGIGIEDILMAEMVITCVVGTHKGKALLAALRAGYLDVAIIDSNAALEVLRLYNLQD
jgi:deoxyribonucleoside regulator